MTTVASVCERWALKLEPTGNDWFADWVLRDPKGASQHLTAGWHAVNSLLAIYEPNRINSVREYFGGIGAQALMIQEAFAPVDHVVQEFSRDAVAHLEREMPAPIRARWADSYEPGSCFPTDLAVLDFGDLTVWRTRAGEKHRELLDRVFYRQPKAVLLTDIAGPRLHLHRERYGSLLGRNACESYESYIRALVTRITDLWGYGLHTAFTHRWSTVMALVPESVAGLDLIVPTPAAPVGIELL